MVGHKTDDEEAKPPLRPPNRKSPANEPAKGQPVRPEQKSRDIDLERVLYDPEYRQAVQETLSPDKPPGRPNNRDAKPQKG